jgi:formylglycine-generating enzyme required for sulfatase activity
MTIRSRIRGLASAAAAAATVGSLAVCGGQTAEPQQPHPDASVFGPTDASPPPSLGPLLDVPGGYAVEGEWELDWSAKTFRPSAQDLCARTFWVSPFRMMKFEVTAAQYEACVAEGACVPPDSIPQPPGVPWSDPSRRDQPVGVSFPLARAFCQHYGGDLPSDAEWDRAAAGDHIDTFGIAPLTAQWLSCYFGDASGDVCDRLAAAVHIDSGSADSGPPLRDVGSTEWDVGPYGHMDLFDNASEWVRIPAGDLCSYPDGGADPVSYAPDPSDHTITRQLANELGVPDSHTYYVTSIYPYLVPIYVTGYNRGFRCAFPPK